MCKSHRQHCIDVKKFSPKKHRKRIGEMLGKPCPLHDLQLKRKCKHKRLEQAEPHVGLLTRRERALALLDETWRRQPDGGKSMYLMGC